MKVLLVHYRGWPFGGGEIYLFKLLRALVDAGHHVAFLTQKDPLNKKISGLPWYEVPPAPGVRRFKTQWEMLRTILELERPDLIHLHETSGFIGPYVLKRVLSRFPVVSTIHFAGALCPKKGRLFQETGMCLRQVGPYCIRCCTGLRSLKDMILQTWWLMLLQKASFTLVGSTWLQAWCLKNGFSPQKTSIVPPYWHEPLHERASPHMNRNILFVGRVREDKGALDLLQALAELRAHDWELVFVGERDPQERVGEYAASIGLHDRASFTGFVPHSELWRYYQQAAFLVFPSLFPETFGLAGVEAMSAGIPVIAYDGGGVRDWLEHGVNGLLVEMGDVRALAEAIRTMLEDKELRKKMGRAAYESVAAKYTLTSHISNLLKIYGKAMHHNQ